MFGRNASGNVAMLFALLLPALMTAVGGGIEVSRAVEFKQRLTTATDLTCRQGSVYVNNELSDSSVPKNYGTDLIKIAERNRIEKGFGTATKFEISQFPKPVVGVTILTPTAVKVVATGTVESIFKSFVSKQAMTFTVTRDCPVSAPAGGGAPSLLVMESFEGLTSKLSGGWRIFSTLNPQTCDGSTCGSGSSAKKWESTKAGIEVNELAELTGDGIVYGKAFAELDSDCGNQETSSTESANACKTADGVRDGQTTNSSIAIKLDLDPGNYEIRYVYVARKFETSFTYNGKSYYNYPNDERICSLPTDTTGAQRDASVAKTKAGELTKNLDWQTRRIELYVEKKSDGYDFTQSDMVDVCVWSLGWADRGYKFNVKAKSEYRIAWRAAGLDDTRGGLTDYIRICKNSCP